MSDNKHSRRMTREEAMAYHPSNYFHRQMQAIWTPADFDQTVRDAQAVVEAGKQRLRVVGEDERGFPTLMLSQSRERRARWMDFIAVALLMLLMACIGCIVMLLSAPNAKADNGLSDEVVQYTFANGERACQVLDEYPSVPGLLGIMQAIAEDGGFTAYEAGQVAGLSVYEFCPYHADILDRFVAMYGDTGRSVA